MVDAPARTPWHLWLVGIIAVLFNAFGVFDFIMNKIQGAEYLAKSGMTPPQIAYYETLPAWMTLVWAVGVFGAFAGSILLVMRRGAAFPVFAVSLTAFLLDLLYSYGFSNGGAVLGPQMVIVNAVIAALLVFFTLYARAMARRGLLR